jgi:L-lactate dehydrogenase
MTMKVGLIGAGAVGSSCLFSLLTTGHARQIVVVNRNHKRATGMVTDMQYGTPLVRPVSLQAGSYEDLVNAVVVIVTIGMNERTGGATNRNDPQGRLRLLDTNARVYREAIPEIVAAVPRAVILVVTDPPDPLADLTREIAGHDFVLSSGTFLDTLRFRFHLARNLGVDPSSLEAQVVGEHGTSQVFLWSSARVAGVPLDFALKEKGFADRNKFRQQIEQDVRFANITIIEGTGASQFGIGIVAARIADMILRDEKSVVPIGSFNPRYGTTLSLPSVVASKGVERVFEPEMTDYERQSVQASADALLATREKLR